MQHTRQSALDLSHKRPPQKQYVESAGTFLNKGPSGDKKKKKSTFTELHFDSIYIITVINFDCS